MPQTPQRTFFQSFIISNAGDPTGILGDSSGDATTQPPLLFVQGGGTGSGLGAANGQDLLFAAGIPSGDSSGAAGGTVTVRGGAGSTGAAGGPGGDVVLQGGFATNAADIGGSIVLTPGTGGTPASVLDGIVVVSGPGSALQFDEVSSVPGPTIAAGQGRIWVRGDTPNVLVFTDDTGTDTVLGAAGGAGTLTAVLAAGNTSGGTDITMSSGDDIVFDGSGTTISGGVAFSITGTGSSDVTLDTSGGTGDVVFSPGANALVLDYATFPSADGMGGQALTTDGSGNLSWTTVGGSTPSLAAVLAAGDASGGTDLTMSSGDDIVFDGSGTTLSGGAAFSITNTGSSDVTLDTSGGSGDIVLSPGGNALTLDYATFPAADGGAGTVLSTDGSGTLSWVSAASGDVSGPVSSTDNAIVRWDGAGGDTVQNSGVTVDDSDNITNVSSLTMSGTLTMSAGSIAVPLGGIGVSVGNVTVGGSLSTGETLEVTENAAVPGGAPAAGQAKFWVRDDTPNVPVFTDDAGTDNLLKYEGSAPATHATSHENGGSDEISVAGLSGLLADGQTPLSHAASHENGGSDEINVAGLSGLLADGQTPLSHAASHENGGSDEINVAGLSGVLADDQNAIPEDGIDTSAIHDDTASEISAITAKATPTAADFLLIEDAADSNNKKSITIGDLPTGGDVNGPGSSTDNALVRWDGATGGIIQNSGVLLDDSDNLSGIGNITLSGTVDGRDVSADGTTLDSHVGNTSNPHSTTLALALVSGNDTDGTGLGIDVQAGDPLRLVENASNPGAVTAGIGNLWVRNDAPNVMMYTDDAGDDYVLNTGWELVDTLEITAGGGASTLTFSGLDGNNDGYYFIVGRFSSASSISVAMNINGLAVDQRSRQGGTVSNSTSGSGLLLASWIIPEGAGAGTGTFQALIYPPENQHGSASLRSGRRMYTGNFSLATGATPTVETGFLGGCWDNSAGNITSIEINSTFAVMEQGTQVSLYKIRY